MNFAAAFQKYTLKFKFEAGTSRGALTHKDTYFIKVWKNSTPHIYGLGECSVLRGLSMDDREEYEPYLKKVRENVGKYSYSEDFEQILDELISNEYPSIQFGFETALRDLQNGGKRIIYPSVFTNNYSGIPVNGLIWMGDEKFMQQQIDAKLEQGYSCLKMKIGAIDFIKECTLLEYIRINYSKEQITLRVDANGAFSSSEALEKLHILSQFDLHSIEQPIKQGQRSIMKDLCKQTPIPIALDEELISIMNYTDKKALLEETKPQYVILKPSLIGGFRHSLEWIEICENMQIGWWITSALESNIGLNSISQFTATLHNPMPQGLGTGQLYTNNIDSPLEISNGNLFYNNIKHWNTHQLF